MTEHEILRVLEQDIEDLRTGIQTVSDDYIRGFEAAIDMVRDLAGGPESGAV